MSDPWSALRPFYYVQWHEDLGKFWVAKLLHRKNNTLRFAYRVKTASRPRLSPVTSESMVSMFLNEAKRDWRDGRGPVGLQHRMRIYAREIMPARWRSHRKYMAALKERKQMENLPQFGLF